MQSISSDQSGQSGWPSQRTSEDTQGPAVHLNWPARHATHSASSDWSVQSNLPSQRHLASMHKPSPHLWFCPFGHAGICKCYQVTWKQLKQHFNFILFLASEVNATILHHPFSLSSTTIHTYKRKTLTEQKTTLIRSGGNLGWVFSFEKWNE